MAPTPPPSDSPIAAERRVGFGDPDLIDVLGVLDDDALDDLVFGLVVMDRTGMVVAYNREEANLSGLDPANVIGRDFFAEIGPCTNNARVAGRFREHDELDELDETIDYVFTYRMAPSPVRLRMLAAGGSDRQYLVVEKR